MRSQTSDVRSQKSATRDRPSEVPKRPLTPNRRSLHFFCLSLTAFCLLVQPIPALAAFTADLSNGDVSLKLEAVPDKVSPAEDLMLTLTEEAPSHLTVTLPDLRDRFSGFVTAEDFATDPVEANGRTHHVYRWRLTPEPAASRYRLAPFAVEILDKRSVPAQRSSFATQPVIFPGQGPRPAVTGDPEVTPTPEWIPPTAKTVTLWVFAAIAGIAACVAILFGLVKLSRRVREYRMSPVERAMVELQRLLGRNLPGRGLYKEFYIELTMVVRRYIERKYGIRAPEQTTQEFLAAAAHQPTFTFEVIAQLRVFLESADLVKFAGVDATVSMTDDATTKARTYIETDATTALPTSREDTSQRAPSSNA